MPNCAGRSPARPRSTSTGSRPDIRVPMREVTQTATDTQHGGDSNEPIALYDTSGAYTDTDASINLRAGLPAIRAAWIAERGDTEVLPQISSAYGRERATADDVSGIRFAHTRLPRRALAGQQRHADALRPARHHHAGDGIHRHPREPAPARGARPGPAAPASGPQLRRRHPQRNHARVRARRSRPRPRHHPEQHQPPGKRTDDHRPQLPGEDQRQHRQLGPVLVDRGRGRKNGLGHPLGLRHHHGPVHRQEHPRNARVDHPQLAGARSAPCPSTRRWKRSTARPRN